MKTCEVATGIVTFEPLEPRLLMSAALAPQVDDAGGDGGNVAALAVLSPGASAADTQHRTKIAAESYAPARVAPVADQNIGALVYGRSFSGNVSNATADVDYVYQFTLAPSLKKPAKPRKFKLSMCGMTNDADVDLLDSNGNILKQSEKWAAKKEKISASLPAGTYYVRVHISSYYTNTFSTPYSLELYSKP